MQRATAGRDTPDLNHPGWGAAARQLWAIDPAVRFINHGAYGAAPLEILAEQAMWRDRMERNTVRFFMNELPGLMRAAAEPLAEFVACAPDRLGFVVNATAATNAVLRSLRFNPGDEIVHTDHVYNAVRNNLRYLADTTGLRLVEARLGMPVLSSDDVVSAVVAAITPRTRLVVVDHVASASAVELPVARIAEACRARFVPCLVDGAHAPGLLDLDVDAIGADWYAGNCHKWLCSPKGAGFLAVANRPTPAIHPLAISHAYGQGFTEEFDRPGTHDPSAMLCVPAAVRFHHRLGGPALRARNRELAIAVAQRMAGDLGTLPGGAPELFHAMATIRLPVATPTIATALALREHLYHQGGFEAAITLLCDAIWLRLSVHAHNDEADFDGLADAVRAAIAAVCPHEGRGESVIVAG